MGQFVSSPQELSDIVLKSNVSHFSITLVETEPEATLGNPIFDYHVLITDYDTGKEIAAYKLLQGIEKKKEPEPENGSIKRRIEHIKEFLSQPQTEQDIAELFMEEQGKKSQTYQLRKKEGYKLSNEDQAAIASGIMHIASIMEPRIMQANDNGKKVIQAGSMQFENLEAKQRIYKEVQPKHYYIPKAMQNK
jgi:hypothetical protein